MNCAGEKPIEEAAGEI